MDSGTTDTDGRVIIGGERASLSLAIADERGGVARGRPFQVDWLTGTADLRLGEVQVSRPIAARPDDLMCFAAELDDCVTLLLGSASFASLDDGLLIDITMGTLGHALVSGIIRFEVGEAQGDLSFSYPSDQTYLAATLRQLLAVLDGHATALDDAAPGPAGWLF